MSSDTSIGKTLDVDPAETGFNLAHASTSVRPRSPICRSRRPAG